MRDLPKGALGPETTRVFLAVLRLAWGATTTVESAGAAAGISKGTAHKHLVRLRAAGLIDWEDGHKATIHPTVFVVPRAIDKPYTPPVESG